jgi:Na+-driven multidrug efflux pump
MMSLAIHMVGCYYLVDVLKMGEVGAAIATNITYFSNMLINDLLCFADPKISRSFAMPTREIFNDVGEYLSLGLPGVLITSFEWWCWEALAISVGMISVEALACQTVAETIA